MILEDNANYPSHQLYRILGLNNIKLDIKKSRELYNF